MPVVLECEFCGEEYEVIPSRKDSSRFCSNNCKSKYQEESLTGSDNPCWRGGHTETKDCEWCGEEYERRSDRIGRFCSVSCRSSWQSEEMIGEDATNWKGGPVALECEFCEEKYEVKESESDKSRFCSLSCMGLWKSENWRGDNCPNWEGGAQKDYGPLWNKIREEVRNRDGGCEECGMSVEEHIYKYDRKPDVHHIVPISKFDDFDKANNKENLVTLCRDCHAKVESGKKDLSVSSPYNNT